MMKRLTEANIKTDPKILDEVAACCARSKKVGMPSARRLHSLKEITMSLVLQRIEETREALVDALAERNWEAIGELDLACRSCMEDVMSEARWTRPRCAITLRSCSGFTSNCSRRRPGSGRR
jgi:hypothetical protein